LAIEEWLTPNGQSFWHKGVNPDFPVALPTDVTPLFPGAERGLTSKEVQEHEDRQLVDALNLVGRLTAHENITSVRSHTAR